jgi:hypothetical protein
MIPPTFVGSRGSKTVNIFVPSGEAPSGAASVDDERSATSDGEIPCLRAIGDGKMHAWKPLL